LIVALEVSQVSAIAALITAVVAIIALTFAWKQVAESKELREQQSRPYVVVDFRYRSALAVLSIENIGSTVASDIAISVERPFESTIPGVDPMGTHVMREGIPMLVPGRRIEILFDSVITRFESDLPMTYEVAVSYAGYRNTIYRDIYVLDFDHVKETLMAERSTSEILESGLKKIESSLKAISTEVHSVNRTRHETADDSNK